MDLKWKHPIINQRKRRISAIKTPSPALIILTAIILAGCGTVQEHRERQYAFLLDSVPLSMIETARQGSIIQQMPPVAVYIALGTPEYTKKLSDNQILWAYWGKWPDGQSISDSSISFLARSELRIPSPGETREELHLIFHEGKLYQWKRDPLTDDDLQYKREIPYGTLPEIP